MKPFSGKAAIVTAGGNGIGRASSLSFAREGASVMVSDIDAAAGQAVVGEIRAAGGTAEFQRTDVTREDEVEALVKAAVAQFGRLDFAHNNAGNMWGSASFGDYSADDWDKTIDLTMKGIWLCLRAELPAMAASGGGAIVNTTSMAGLRTHLTANAAYSAAKAGVVSLTAYAAKAYADKGIRVNAVAPGLVRTAAVEQRYARDVQDKMAAKSQLIGRIIEPQEIADGVIFLCSDKAAMITGTTLPVAGGNNVV